MSAEVRAYYEVLLLRIIGLALREGVLAALQAVMTVQDEAPGRGRENADRETITKTLELSG